MTMVVEAKMLRWAAAMVDVRKGRRAAVAKIGPLVEQSRIHLNGIPETAWRDPYLVGFMLTLITIVARIESRTLQDRDLSVVQSQAWSAITDMDADLIGEDALTLSTSHPQEFQYGCHRATIVASRLCGTAAVASLDPVSARKVMELLVELNKRDGLGVIVTLHQVDYAIRYCDRVIALKAGQVVYDGPATGLDTKQLIDIYGPEFEDAFWEAKV